MNEEIKLWFIGLGGISISFVTFMGFLRGVLLVVLICYTCVKLFYLINDRKNKNKKL